MGIEAVQEADGSWTLTAVTDSVEGDGYVWHLSDGSIPNGQEINHFFATGSEIETACVTATFWDCEEILTECIDLENGGAGFCEEVEVELDGETLADLLAGLDMAWTLYGDLFDLEGEMTLDPADGELGTLVLCLPPGCYGMTFDMQGVPGLDGLPGMTLSLAVGEEEEIEVDPAILEGQIDLEFGVQTDCGSQRDGDGIAVARPGVVPRTPPIRGSRSRGPVLCLERDWSGRRRCGGPPVSMPARPGLLVGKWTSEVTRQGPT